MPTLSPNLLPEIDPSARIKPLVRAHERFIESGEVAGDVPGAVAHSWRRCRSAGVDPGGALAPVQLTEDELDEHRDNHPLADALPVFRELLGRIAEESRFIMAVADADARLLWVEGHPELRRRAEAMHFVEGAAWAEQYAGTNAPGTAIATDGPVQIFTAEHFSHVVQPWSCAAAPVRDPHTKEVLGVIDITGGDHLGSPSCLALVRASALAAEGELRRRRPLPTPAGEAVAEPSVTVQLEVLGRDDGILTIGPRRHRLSRRHAEILALLAQRPDGLTAEQLSEDLYGMDANSTTLRAEMVRIRRLLPESLIESRPYRLLIPVCADFVEVLELLHRGELSKALDRYRGPLLPHSQAPAIEEERRRVEQQMRAALIGKADPELLERWLNTPWGRDDRHLWQLLARAARTATTSSIAFAEARRLADDDPHMSPGWDERRYRPAVMARGPHSVAANGMPGARPRGRFNGAR